jgi:hypothetical protein
MMDGPMDHFVKLDRLPDGYEFPTDLKDRIHFDAQARKLVFHGYMSKADFDRLCQQTKDWGFRRALEELFRLSVAEVKPRPAKARGLLSVIRRFFASR